MCDLFEIDGYPTIKIAEGNRNFEYQGDASVEALVSYMGERRYYQSEIVREFTRERTYYELFMRLLIRVSEEFLTLVEFTFYKLGLGELSLTIKMLTFVTVVGIPCFLLCILATVEDTPEVPVIIDKKDQ